MSTPFVPGIWGVAVVQAVTGFAGGLFSLHIMAWIMQRVDAAVRGRVSSMLVLSSLGMAPISMALSGFLATSSVTVQFALPGGCLLAVAASAAFVRSVRRIR